MTEQTDVHVYDANLESGADLRGFFESDSLVIATRFFRNEDLFRDLDRLLIPTLIKGPLKARPKLRIWSAGCSDGREAYSLAIAADRSLRKYNASKIRIDIRGSDVSRPQIEKAKAGKYTISGHDREQVDSFGEYFESTGSNTRQVVSRIRDLVTFMVEDIIEHSPTDLYDILICSLVILYYEQEYQKDIISRLIGNVRPGGYFYIAPVNRRWLVQQGHIRVGGKGGAFFQRDPQGQG